MSRKSKTPTRRQSTEDASEAVDWSAIGPTFSFDIQYPTPASKKRKRDDWTEPQAQPNPLTDSVEPRLYTVKPAHLWESAVRYRKFTISHETFEVNDIVLVAKDEPNSNPKGKSSRRKSEVAKLLENKWVAQVLEVRAGDEQHVYLRVFWLFRPEDLPIGRQDYHGAMEIIPSNDMQIIDAMTVDGKITVQRWDEYDDDDDPDPDQLYWRQTFDARKGKTGLSELRKHCICKLPANPDKLLIQCQSCKQWQHAECIEEDAVKRAYEDAGEEYNAEPTANGEVNGAKSASKKKPKRKSKGAAASNGHATLFEAELESKSSDKKETKSILKISDLRDDPATTTTENLQCLLCHKEID